MTHHAPSRAGLNPAFIGNGLDGAYASDLDALVEASGAAAWIHGHTHIRRKYRIGSVNVYSNCRGFADKDPSARNFNPGSFSTCSSVQSGRQKRSLGEIVSRHASTISTCREEGGPVWIVRPGLHHRNDTAIAEIAQLRA